MSFFLIQFLRISSTEEKKKSLIQKFFSSTNSSLFCLLKVTKEAGRAAGRAHTIQNISQLAHLGPGANSLL